MTKTTKPIDAPADTVSYAILVGKKNLQLSNVPVEQNTTYFHSQVISMYSVLPEGEYTFEGTDITVKVTEVD